MKKALILTALVTLAVAVFGFPKSSPQAQEVLTGDWAAKMFDSGKGPRLRLTLNSTGDNGKNQFNSSFDRPLQDFSGLNPNAGANTSFSLQREAGSVVFQGLFTNGKGVGEFRFTPNRGFISAFSSQEQRRITTDELFAMTIHDVSTAFINELKWFGYDNL